MKRADLILLCSDGLAIQLLLVLIIKCAVLFVMYTIFQVTEYLKGPGAWRGVCVAMELMGPPSDSANIGNLYTALNLFVQFDLRYKGPD